LQTETIDLCDLLNICGIDFLCTVFGICQTETTTLTAADE
jgi:hypothetical protein